MAKTNHAGDFHLRRENKDMVMIENKDYKANVGFDSVEKFRNDCKDLNMHGVIISHHSGIATKRDYSVEIFDNKVLVYLTNVEYDGCKILTAVNLIDNLSAQLNKICNINNSDNISIDQDTMLDINEELTNFIQQKEKLYKSINKTTSDLKEVTSLLKDQNKSADDQYEDMRQGILAVRKKKREDRLENSECRRDKSGESIENSG